MLIDDDYPVLELVSNSVLWEDLGLQLDGVYENGAIAFEKASLNMPDILITDIGMPKMNGIELIQRLKEKKPSLCIVILSCHSEFHYAQQAMKLNVQDYLIKDTFDPDDLYKLMEHFKQKLDQERETDKRHVELKHMENNSKVMLKNNFIRNMIHRPILDRKEWLKEAQSFGLDLESGVCLPVIGFVDHYQLTTKRFNSDDIFKFAMDNVMDEMVRENGGSAIHFSYGTKETFVIHTFKPSLKVNIFDHVNSDLKQIQSALQKSLKVSMSFLIGEICRTPEELKRNVTELLTAHNQRFYLKKSELSKIQAIQYNKEDIFRYFEKALSEFRELMIQQKSDELTQAVMKWMKLIEEEKYPQEAVKDWVLKLMLDLKLKFQSMRHFRSSYSAETLHKEIGAFDSLEQLEDWLIHYFRTAMLVVGDILEQSSRTEVVSAIHYVSQHLHERISLENISQHLHLNSSYFSRLFRKETGETFIEYVTKTKMERAKELLDQTDYTVNKICEMLGYDNQSYFIKTFKTYTGLTPIEYRG